jgi:hypothetical protein
VQAMGDAPQHHREILQLIAQRIDAMMLPLRRHPLLFGPIVQLMRQHGYALQRVIVDFSGDPRPLLLVCVEEILRVSAMEAEKATLIDDQGGTEREENHAQRQCRG